MSSMQQLRPVTTLEAILETVARREGVPVTRLQPPLYEAVDPDALEALLTADRTASRQPISVQFEYAGYDVTARSDGTFAVE